MQRQFTSGSRQAPDPFDQFLEENNFYRKHTARDASCLFRVISEQMYDTQLHHLAIRKKCVRYMRKHRDFFAPLIERDLDEYLDDMSKPKTYGTLIELQAVGYMFQRNVLLFEPFNLGNFYSTRTYFNDVFRVFYTPERHFDSVFTCDYIKDAAICQAICYEILYKDLYKLPDVAFAVEHMLHSPTLEATEYTSETNENGYCTRIHLADGRSFKFDLPQDTNCILENYELCHFHYINFPRLSDDLHREMKIRTNCDDYEKSALCKTAESLLPHKYISCVRQLLQEGITPFPYKVAKALDPHMYRNIEFDAWNEQRKEQKLQNWYNGDSNFKLIRCQQTRVHKIFQVGAKCHVKLCKSENDLYTCHIQEIAVDKGYCVVFVEQLGEKRLVPYDSLTPLPPDQFKPWTLPYRFQRHMQKYSSVRLTRHYNYRFKLNGQFGSSHNYCTSMTPPSVGKSSEYLTEITSDDIDKDEKQHYVNAAAATTQHHRNGCYYKLKQYTHFENFRAHTVEYCAMPLTVEHNQRDLDAGTKNGSGGGTHTPSHDNNSNAPARSTLPSEMRIKTEPTNTQQQRMAGGGGGVGGSCGTPEDMMMGTFNALEHTASAGINAPAFIIPDFHYLYPAPQYGTIPEEYYAYGYDPSMHSPAAAFMPTGYYMYPPPPPGAPPAAAAFAPPPNNLYMQTAPPLPPPLITAAAAHPVAPHLGGGGGGGVGSAGQCPFYSPNVPFAAITPANTMEQNNTASPQVQYETANNRNRGGCGHTMNATPLSPRINWDAKKSIDTSGIDLPTDVATLRHFYNLGLEYHFMHLKQRNGDNDANAKSNIGKDTAKASTGGTTNEDHLHESKPDTNNNTMTNLNANLGQTPNKNVNQHTPQQQHQHINGSSGNNGNNNSNSIKGGAHMHNKRYSARYFNNNKERPNFLRNNQNYANNSHTSNSNLTNSHDCNHNSNVPGGGVGGGGTGNGSGNKYANTVKTNNIGQSNSNRSATPNSLHSHASTQNVKANTGGGSGSTGSATAKTHASDHGNIHSPHGSYDNQTNGIGGGSGEHKMLKHTSLPMYQTAQTNTMMAGPYSPYGGGAEFNGGDPSMPMFPPTTAAGSIYLHMPMPAPGHTFGLYAPPPSALTQAPPPHTNPIGLHPTPTSTTCTPIPFPTPSPNGGSTHGHYMPSPTEAVNMALQGPPNGFYGPPPPSHEHHSTTTAPEMGGGGDGIQFQCIPYAPGVPPPPIPFYYTAANGGGMPMNISQPSQVSGGGGGGSGCGNAGISGGPGTMAQHGYWCQPSNALLPLPTSTAQMNGSASGSGSGTVVPTPTNGNTTINANASSANSRSRENK